MKKHISLLIIIALIFSCNTKKSEDKISDADTTASTTPLNADSIKTDNHYFWSAELDPKKGLVMVKTIPINADSLTASHIIQMLNETYPDIPLQFNKISGDSIFVNIPNSNYLANQMGTSGAEAYLAEVTYNLTELNGINYVSFKFKEGNHAAPNVFTRTDFVSLK